MPTSQELEQFWLGAPEGKLCAREQAKAWALREFWLGEGWGQHGLSFRVHRRSQAHLSHVCICMSSVSFATFQALSLFLFFVYVFPSLLYLVRHRISISVTMSRLMCSACSLFCFCLPVIMHKLMNHNKQ